MWKDIYKTRRRLRVIAAGKTCPLRLNDRLIYSALVEDVKFDRRTSKAAMAARLSLSPATVAVSIERLNQHGLASQMVAFEPPDDKQGWFVVDGKTKGKWVDRFCSWPLYLPSPEGSLRVQEAAVLSMLYSLSRGAQGVTRQSYRGLEALLGIDRKAVARALRKLEALKLLQTYPNGPFFDVILAVPTAEQRELFAGRAPASYKPSPAFQEALQQLEESPDSADMECVADALESKVFTPMSLWTRGKVNTMQKKMDAANYSYAEIEGFFMHLARLCQYEEAILYEFLFRFGDKFSSVDREHRRNCEKGKVKNVAANSRHLLEYKTVQWVGRLLEDMDTEKVEAMSSFLRGTPPDDWDELEF